MHYSIINQEWKQQRQQRDQGKGRVNDYDDTEDTMIEEPQNS